MDIFGLCAPLIQIPIFKQRRHYIEVVYFTLFKVLLAITFWLLSMIWWFWIQVLDTVTGEELGPSQSGELCIKGPQVDGQI